MDCRLISPAVVAVYGLNVPALFDQFSKQTDNPIAAALLVLASVHSEPEGVPEPLLNVKQVAEKLNCASRTVYDLAASGRLKSVRIGAGRGSLRFRESDLEMYQRPRVDDDLHPDFAALLA